MTTKERNITAVAEQGCCVLQGKEVGGVAAAAAVYKLDPPPSLRTTLQLDRRAQVQSDFCKGGRINYDRARNNIRVCACAPAYTWHVHVNII